MIYVAVTLYLNGFEFWRLFNWDTVYIYIYLFRDVRTTKLQ